LLKVQHHVNDTLTLLSELCVSDLRSCCCAAGTTLPPSLNSNTNIVILSDELPRWLSLLSVQEGGHLEASPLGFLQVHCFTGLPIGVILTPQMQPFCLTSPNPYPGPKATPKPFTPHAHLIPLVHIDGPTNVYSSTLLKVVAHHSLEVYWGP
jgi:hypothetical protein